MRRCGRALAVCRPTQSPSVLGVAVCGAECPTSRLHLSSNNQICQTVNIDVVCFTNICVCHVDIHCVCSYQNIMGARQIYRNLGIRIKGLRGSLGLTQDQLAKQVGISRASLANIERGKQQVLVHHLFAIAESLQLESPTDLLLAPQAGSRRHRAQNDLPLAEEGLTDKQRQEVLSLVGGVLEIDDHGNSGENSRREDQ